MNTAEDEPFPAVRTDDELLHLQLRIAQLADKLSPAHGKVRPPSDDYACWLEAEQNVMQSLRRRSNSGSTAN